MRMFSAYAANSALLLGAMLVAVQIRLKIGFGSTLYANYDAQPFMMYVLLLAASLIPLLAREHGEQQLPLALARRQFIDLLLSIVFASLAIVIFLPDLSLLQLTYFVCFAALLGLATIWYPARALAGKARPSVWSNLEILWNNRNLLMLWVENNVRARYAQAFLGIIWIILLPLAQALTLALVFSRFVHMDVGNVPYISFFFAALVPWTFFNQALINSSSAVVNMIGLINQIYFPREILVLVKLGEVTVDVAFMFIALLIINLFVGILPNIYYVFLLPIFAIIFILALSLSLFLSYLTVLIRDIPQFLFVVLQLAFYMTPILYSVSFIPPEFRFLVLINPLAPLIQACRDIIVYQRMPDLLTLPYPIVAGLALLYIGYSFFKANEKRLADYV